MYKWSHQRAGVLISSFLIVAVALCESPAWSQKPGATNPNVGNKTTAPLSPKAPNSSAAWNLTDILWGIARLQKSPQKLSAAQVKKVRPTVQNVVDGTNTVKGFETKVKGILTAEQLAYVQHLSVTGELSKLPADLPPSEAGHDPLVQYVIAALEKKAK